MATVSFKKGLLANLPAAKAAGTFYVTTDERAMYLDVDDSTRIRLGDFQEFANTTALMANANPSTTALYYVSDINCLAKWNGAEYVQINKDTGMTSIEVTGDGNAVTAAVYDATGRKLTLTKGATYMTAADVDGKISGKVGAIEGTVKDYVDEKTSGIASDAALTALAGRVTTAEGKITALEDANKEGGAVANAIADAKKAGTDAQATANQAKAAAAAAQADVDALKGKVGTVPADKTVVGMIGEVETAYKAKDNELAASIKAISDDYLKSTDKTELQGNIDKKVDQTAYNAKVTELVAADTTLQNNIDAEKAAREAADTAQVTRIATLESQITGLSGAMHFEGVKGEVPADVSGYEAGDVIIVGEKEYVFDGTAFVEFGDVSAEGERIAALETTVGDENSGLVKDIADEITRAKAAEKANADAIVAQATSDAATYETKADASAKLTEAKEYADGLNTAMDARVDALEADTHTHANKALLDTYTQTEADLADAVAKKHSHGNKTVLDGITAEKVSAWDSAESNAKTYADGIVATEKARAEGAEKANADAITALQTGKADKATTLAGYGITDAYTQAEVNALLTWGEF